MIIKKRLNLLLATILFFCVSHISTGLVSTTIIQTSDGPVPISLLSDRHCLLSLNTAIYDFCEAKIVQISKEADTSIYQITIPGDTILCSGEQLFFDPTEKRWISAKKYSTGSHFLNSSLEAIPCIAITKIAPNSPTLIYDISLTLPYTFFITQSKILTHNIAPLIAGPIIALAETEVAIKICTALGIMTLLLWEKYHNTKIARSSDTESSTSPSYNSLLPPDPEDPQKRNTQKIDNMDQFFKTDFGQKIRASVEKTNRQYDGQTIYRVKEKIPEYGLKKGDLFYLDNLHKDHLEVFSKSNKLKTVLNLDGTENLIKLAKSAGRRL